MPDETKLDDRLATADALIAAAANRDDEGLALLWSKVPEDERMGVVLLLAYRVHRLEAMTQD